MNVPLQRRRRGRTVRNSEQLRELDLSGVLTGEQYATIWRLLDGGARTVILDTNHDVLEVT